MVKVIGSFDNIIEGKTKVLQKTVQDIQKMCQLAEISHLKSVKALVFLFQSLYRINVTYLKYAHQIVWSDH